MNWINRRRVWGLIIGFILLMLALFIIPNLNKDNSPPQKPEIIKPTPQKQGKWYVVFKVNGQRITAYTAYPGTNESSSGKKCFLGSVAVHPRVPRNQGGSVFEPVIPYETQIYLSNPIKIQGKNYNNFTVLDTGDVNYRLWQQYPYWIDVYWGTSSAYTLSEAQEFGIDLVDYFWVEEWR